MELREFMKKNLVSEKQKRNGAANKTSKKTIRKIHDCHGFILRKLSLKVNGQRRIKNTSRARAKTSKDFPATKIDGWQFI